MLEVYDKTQKDDWNKIIKSFANWDIYYLYEYAYSFMVHGDGDMYLIHFVHNNERLAYVVMQNDISLSDKFSGILAPNKYYDWETPYGYGGPLLEKPLSEEAQLLFMKELTRYCNEKHIISQFVRFHPLLKNFEVLPKFIEARYLRDTIFIDTYIDKAGIMANIDRDKRNKVRKAVKNGVTILERDIDDIKEFIQMYNETMLKNGADEYYIFDKDYFESLSNMRDNACIFYAKYNEKIVSGAVIFYNDRYAHYHLGGSHTEYRKYYPVDLLFYEVACWAHEKGIRLFHLGGGMTPDDSLFGFKKQFNRNGRLSFVVGRTVFDKEVYEKLLDIRETNDKTFNRDNSFMIQYRR